MCVCRGEKNMGGKAAPPPVRLFGQLEAGCKEKGDRARCQHRLCGMSLGSREGVPVSVREERGLRTSRDRAGYGDAGTGCAGERGAIVPGSRGARSRARCCNKWGGHELRGWATAPSPPQHRNPHLSC